MEKIYGRTDLINLLYHEHLDGSPDIVKQVRGQLMRIGDIEFIEWCKNSNIHIGLLRRNTYYIKTR
jgi:hypothetical protein